MELDILSRSVPNKKKSKIFFNYWTHSCSVFLNPLHRLFKNSYLILSYKILCVICFKCFHLFKMMLSSLIFSEEIDLKLLKFNLQQSVLNHWSPSLSVSHDPWNGERHSRHFPASQQQSQHPQMLQLLPPQSRSHLKEKALDGDLETKV